MNVEYTNVNINEIIVSDNRKRKVDDEDYLSLLEENIKELGLIEPIMVDKNKVLIAGAHRLTVCKRLGMETIPCSIQSYEVEDATKEVIEISENLIRKNLSSKEIVQQYRILDKYYKSKGISNTGMELSKINNETERMNHIRIKIGKLIEPKEVYSKIPDDVSITTLIALSRNIDVIDVIKNSPVGLTNEELKNAIKESNFLKKGFSDISEEATTLRKSIQEERKETEEVKVQSTNTNNNEEKSHIDTNIQNDSLSTSDKEHSEDEVFKLLKNEINEYLIDICEEVNTTISKNELNRILNDIKSKCDEFLRK